MPRSGLQLLEYDCVSFFLEEDDRRWQVSGPPWGKNRFDTGKEGVTCRAQLGDS